MWDFFVPGNPKGLYAALAGTEELRHRTSVLEE